MTAQPQTYETLAPDIVKIAVPLPKSPLKITNSYFIRGDRRSLLIDTGFNHPLPAGALREAVEQLNIDMRRTDIFLTHLHSDHTGLCQTLATPQTRIFISHEDSTVVAGGKDSPYWEGFTEFFRLTGLERAGYGLRVADHPGYAYAPEAADNYTTVEDGHIFQIGRYTLRCLLTKGHTRGHLCLYEEEGKRLFAGDHILAKITPNITQFDFSHNALEEYLASLDLLASLDIAVAFPGHRVRIDDVRGRIEELKKHHQARLDEVRRIVGDEVVDTVAVTRRMRWSLSIDNWEDYPPAQKIFSAGEALAHLHHLSVKGELKRTMRDGVALYERSGR